MSLLRFNHEGGASSLTARRRVQWLRLSFTEGQHTLISDPAQEKRFSPPPTGGGQTVVVTTKMKLDESKAFSFSHSLPPPARRIFVVLMN